MAASIPTEVIDLPGDPEETAGLGETERLAQQKTRHTARRARAKAATRKGLLIVYTGKGKGKTTAAVGLLVRAWGQGLRVCMLQFIKARTGKWGEIQATQKFGIELLPLGDGFTWLSQNIEEDKALARAGVGRLPRAHPLRQLRFHRLGRTHLHAQIPLAHLGRDSRDAR